MTQSKINQAWAMYQGGKTYKEIGEELGYSTSWIGYVIMRNIKQSRYRGQHGGKTIINPYNLDEFEKWLTDYRDKAQRDKDIAGETNQEIAFARCSEIVSTLGLVISELSKYK